MELTIKTQYGIRTILDIAYHHGSGPVQRKHIVMRQGIPTDYLDLVLTRMKEHGLIHSFRGREGGYHLAMSPEELTVWDVVEAVEDAKHNERFVPTPAQDDMVCVAARHVTEPALDLMVATIKRNLKRLTIESLLEEGEGRLVENGFDPAQLLESRPKITMIRKPNPARNPVVPPSPQ